MKPPSQTTSPAAIRWFPLPPPAAPAAGGWGNPGSRRVYSVGLSRLLTGGVLEAEASVVGVLGSSSSSPMSSFFGASPSSRRLPSVLAVLGDRRARSFPGWIPVRRIQIKKSKLLMLKSGGAAGLAMDGGSLEFEVRQLPVRRGSSSFQGLEDAAGGASSARLVPRRRLCVAEGPVCFFYLCGVSFCNFWISI